MHYSGKSRREEQTGVRRGIFLPEEKEVTEWRKVFTENRRNSTHHQIFFGQLHQGIRLGDGKRATHKQY